jgi:hypothetical protein
MMAEMRQEHWNNIFTIPAEESVSWFQATPETSLDSRLQFPEGGMHPRCRGRRLPPA